MHAAARIANPQYLVETDWLAAHLADPELRVFDCTTYLDPDPVKVFPVRSGRPEWEQGYIPGDEAQLDFGFAGQFLDPESGRVLTPFQS